VPLGYPTWTEFLREQAAQAGAEAEIEARLDQGEYEEAAKLLLSKRGPRAFYDAIDIFFDEARITGSRIGGSISYVPRLTRGLLVTTNFDRVLERVCLEQLGETLERVMGADEQTATSAVQSGRRAILKIHGDIKERAHRVLTTDDYDRAYGPAEGKNDIPKRLTSLLEAIFTRRVLFLGASLHADRTVRVLASSFSGNQDLAHYAVVERPNDPQKRHERAAHLSNLGIRPIWYPEGRHELVESLLAYLVATREEREAAAADGAIAAPPLVEEGEDWLRVEEGDDAPREIIGARLDALEGSLRRPDDPSEWPRRLNLDTPVVPQQLWGRLTEQMNTKRERQCEELNQIVDELAAGEGEDEPELGTVWADYSRLSSESRRLFRDFLELLGGLAVRGKLGDERLLRVADQLLKECAEDMWGQDSSVAIPAIEEALARTPTGIVRLRFPEWTIWNLALIAHEYGHVVMDEKLEEPLREATKSRLEALGRSAEERHTRRARRQLQVLLADGFASHVLGPAYGCAAIVLKLDPSAEADWDSPSDAERAHVVFATLKKLDGFKKSPSYRRVVAFLEDRWQQLVARVEPGAALEQAQKAPLDEFVDRLDDAFRHDPNLLRSSAAYPYHAGGPSAWDPPEGGWLVAERWARGWLEGLVDPGAPAVEIPDRSRIRDLLNAAWICRIAEPTRIEAIAKLAEGTCAELVPEPDDEGGDATGTPSKPTAHKVPARR
jgi:hypothetical protein